MDDTIEIKEGTASAPVEVAVQEATPQGWMGFYRQNSSFTFSVIYDNRTNHNRDSHRCPYPLFESREAVIEAGKAAFYGKGGELRIVKVTL